jgi:hypothetical protein
MQDTDVKELIRTVVVIMVCFAIIAATVTFCSPAQAHDMPTQSPTGYVLVFWLDWANEFNTIANAKDVILDTYDQGKGEFKIICLRTFE